MSKHQPVQDDTCRHKFKPSTLAARQAAYDTLDEDWLDDVEHLALPHYRFGDGVRHYLEGIE